MHLLRNYILYFFSLIIIACTTPTQTDEIKILNKAHESIVEFDDPQRFADVYDDFFKSIIDSNAENFNKYISPEYGLYIIESAGAMPQMVNVKDISTFRGLNDKRSFFGFNKTDFDCELKEEELPVVDCDSPDGFYTKSGCYTQAVNTFAGEKIWMYCNLQAQQEETVAIVAVTITQTVINTYNYKYYFSLLDGEWYITFIDLRTPCSA
ncbi:MAG: hypothetical protein ABII90_04355 [Bacteroidota bacterium]